MRKEKNEKQRKRRNREKTRSKGKNKKKMWKIPRDWGKNIKRWFLEALFRTHKHMSHEHCDGHWTHTAGYGGNK